MPILDFYRTMADLAYEEHMKQENNVFKDDKNCPYDNTKYVNSVDVTPKQIEEKKEN